jgi:hypothetical protein
VDGTDIGLLMELQYLFHPIGKRIFGQMTAIVQTKSNNKGQSNSVCPVSFFYQSEQSSSDVV